MANPEAGTELGSKMARIESLVEAIERDADPLTRERLGELVSTLMEFHGEALAKTFEILERFVADWPAALGQVGKDRLAGSLLLLHGLHPDDVASRVNEALTDVRPSLQAHQGDVEILAIEKSTVRLRLKGTCHGCPSSAETFRKLIASAIQDRAPEIESVQVEGMVGT